MNNRSISTTTGKTKIKIAFLGDQSVGKTCMIDRYVKDHFDETSHPTVGIDFLVKNITHGSKMYRLQLWDTAGQERFRSLIPNYLKDAKCSLIIFDVSNKVSLNNAQMWKKLFNDNSLIQGFTVLVANKIDLEYKQISTQQGKKKAEQLGIPYFEVSAKTGENLPELFEKIVDLVEQRTVSFDLSKKAQPIKSIKQQQENQREQDTQIKDKPKKVSQNIVDEAGKQHSIVLKNKPNKDKQNQAQQQRKKGCC